MRRIPNGCSFLIIKLPCAYHKVTMRVLSCFFECDILKIGKANVRKRNCYDYSGGSTEAHKVCTKAHKLPMNYLSFHFSSKTKRDIIRMEKENTMK